MGKGVHDRWNEEVSGSGNRREWEPDGIFAKCKVDLSWNATMAF
jgi:hypothetical protein